MNDRRRTLVAITIILGTVVLIVVGVGILLTRSSVVSPVPQNESGGSIKIIYISPTVSPVQSSTPHVPQTDADI